MADWRIALVFVVRDGSRWVTGYRVRALARCAAASARWAAVLLALSVVAPGRGSAAPALSESELRRFAETRARELGVSLPPDDASRLVAFARTRLEIGRSSTEVRQWLGYEILSRAYAGLPANPHHDPAARYRLPYDTLIPRIVTQGYDTDRTHKGWERFSTDFLLPVGEPIYAARAGVVHAIVDGFGPAGAEAWDEYRSNMVLIRHEDGTASLYLHVLAGIPVVKGQRIQQGQLVAWGGSSGSPTGPHLHFAVLRKLVDGSLETIPVRFGVGDPAGFVPQTHQYYGATLHPNRKLVIHVDGKPLREGEEPKLRRGTTASLRAHLVEADGSLREVTADPRTRFGSLTEWSTQVDASGTVTARPAPGLEGTADPSWGTVVIVFGRPGDDALAITKVDFDLRAGGASTGRDRKAR